VVKNAESKGRDEGIGYGLGCALSSNLTPMRQEGSKGEKVEECLR